ncbi:hypothetical protein QE152_g30976 [Popillia japonica]|uniref:Uncharacterized protein n=1 Tax=Popillia japonica TaxID=7064 RepID=A0AAW1JCT2_POPJA
MKFEHLKSDMLLTINPEESQRLINYFKLRGCNSLYRFVSQPDGKRQAKEKEENPTCAQLSRVIYDRPMRDRDRSDWKSRSGRRNSRH